MKKGIEKLRKNQGDEEMVGIKIPKLAGKTIAFYTFKVDDPDVIAQILPFLEASRSAEKNGAYVDVLVLQSNEDLQEDRKYKVNFFVTGQEVLCVIPPGHQITFALPQNDSWSNWGKEVDERNNLLELTPPDRVPTPVREKAGFSKARIKAPPQLSQPTFYEARTGATALSDGRDLRDWKSIEGVVAMLHAPKDAIMQTRFEPCALLLNWWGQSAGAELETLQNELQRLEFAALVTYMVCLSWAIEEYQVTTSLDSVIEAIGWGNDARRSTQKRQEMRAKVWRWMLLFDSLAVIGARPGTWKEPRDGDKKREKIDPDKLYSRDALLKIIGTRATEQGTFDNSAPPKEITFVAGAWVNEFRGNREILSELGDVRIVASIPRGKPSGAWAACVGFALNQKWREQAAKAPVTRVTIGDKKALTQKFRPFTRRVLLAQLWRSDVDPEEILKGKNPSFAKEYWESAIEILKQKAVIGIYREIEPLPEEREGWQDAWFDQPLDIRPTGESRKNAIIIHQSAQEARKRTRKKIVPSDVPKTG